MIRIKLRFRLTFDVKRFRNSEVKYSTTSDFIDFGYR